MYRKPKMLVSSLVACLFTYASARVSVIHELEKWDQQEIAVVSSFDETTSNPFLVEFTAIFQRPDNSNYTALGFYDGSSTFKVRYMPDTEGKYKFVTKCTSVSDLDSQTGTFTVTRPTKRNMGPARANEQYPGQVDPGATAALGFSFDNGEPYFVVGTTSYAWVHQPEGDALEELTLSSLAASPFNKIRMTVFPKYYPFTHTEPRFYPFEQIEGRASRSKGRHLQDGFSWDYSKFNLEFWHHLEKRVSQVQAMGVTAELILFHPYDGGHWGFDRMNTNCTSSLPDTVTGGDSLWCDLHYIRYLSARLSSFRSVWWSMANEWDLMKAKSEDDWDRMFQMLAKPEVDPSQHERSIHNCVRYYNNSRPWVTHVSLQGHTVDQLNMAKQQWPGKPITWDEVQYEGNITYGWGSLTGREEAERAWLALSNGVYMAGHSETELLYPAADNCTGAYNPNFCNATICCNPIMWWNKGGSLRGDSVSRLHFMRALFESPTVPPLGAMQSLNVSTDVYMLYRPGEYYLIYWDSHPTNIHELNETKISLTLGGTSAQTFVAEKIDFWGMVIEEENTLSNLSGGSTFSFRPNTTHFVLQLTLKE